jgi:seryl-tRNA synthetase
MRDGKATARRVLEVDKRIRALTTERDKLTGEIKADKRVLKKHGCKTVKEAKAKLKEMKKELEAKEAKLNKQLDKVEEALDECGTTAD